MFHLYQEQHKHPRMPKTLEIAHHARYTVYGRDLDSAKPYYCFSNRNRATNNCQSFKSTIIPVSEELSKAEEFATRYQWFGRLKLVKIYSQFYAAKNSTDPFWDDYTINNKNSYAATGFKIQQQAVERVSATDDFVALIKDPTIGAPAPRWFLQQANYLW